MRFLWLTLIIALLLSALTFAQSGVKTGSGSVSDPKFAELDKKELAMLKRLESNTKRARQAYFAAPKDSAKKQGFIKAAFAEAEAVLVTPAVPPKQKYPRSLRLYREIVRVDSRHKASLEKISLIESIYKSMNLPIPK